MGTLGGWEWLIILLIVVLLFGAKKLPELSRSLGTSIKEFRKATDDFEREQGDDKPTVRAPDREG